MVRFKVPATTANLGPGFDVLGLALELFDEYIFTEQKSGFTYHLNGAEAGIYGITSDENNMVYRAFCRFYQKVGKNPPGVEISCTSAIPICRGLGSSAAAYVAGLYGANRLTGSPLTSEELLELATELEGHPDNVAPALFGGLVISLVGEGGKILYERFPLEREELTCVLAVPDFTLETKKARGVLPTEIPFKDAVYNISRACLLVAALTNHRYGNLREVMEDRLHQPYRECLIPGFGQVKKNALWAGAYGVAISGAGPTVLALSPANKASEVGSAMIEGFGSNGIAAVALQMKVHNGALE